MKNAYLHPLLETELQDLYDAERQIIEAQPTLLQKASDPELKKSLEMHLNETQEQLKKVEEVADKLDIPLNGTRCLGMQGIIDEAKKHLETLQPSKETDLTIISMMQRIEHYEMAGYGTARNYAQKMEHMDEAQMLDAISNEEGKTDKKLTMMANTLISQESMS